VLFFDGDVATKVRRSRFRRPARSPERARKGTLEAFSLVSDEVMELLLEEQKSPSIDPQDDP